MRIADVDFQQAFRTEPKLCDYFGEELCDYFGELCDYFGEIVKNVNSELFG